MTAFCHGKKTYCQACYRIGSCIKMKNPFGICQRICDLNLENCGHCTEPLQCDEWFNFWKQIENEWAEQEKFNVYYGDYCPGDCDACVDKYSCPDSGYDNGEL